MWRNIVVESITNIEEKRTAILKRLINKEKKLINEKINN